jgi:transposase
MKTGAFVCLRTEHPQDGMPQAGCAVQCEGDSQRQHSTDGHAKLFGISKRGSIYLRRMFIHGARAVLLQVKYDTGRLGQWMRS